ncbi:MAG: DUF4359 domain-containing protein [Leptolyngbyaceae cyanobacterium]
MKPATLLSIVLLVIAIAGLVVTNPGPTAYARYVSVQAETYLSEEICAELPPGLGNLLADQCAELVETLQPQLDSLIRDRTNRLNLGVASLYQTSFGIPELPMLPEYKVETLGILRRFFTYRASQRP